MRKVPGCCVALACLALLLGACASIPLSSLPALSRIDFMTTDIGAFRVALRMPETIRPRPQGVAMDAVVTVEGTEAKTSFLLVPVEDGVTRPGLENAARPGAKIYVYRLSEPDIARFNSLRGEIAAHAQQGRHGSLGLGVTMKEFCSTGAVPQGALATSTYLFAAEIERFVLTVSDYDLRQNKISNIQLAALETC